MTEGQGKSGGVEGEGVTRDRGQGKSGGVEGEGVTREDRGRVEGLRVKE